MSEQRCPKCGSEFFDGDQFRCGSRQSKDWGFQQSDGCRIRELEIENRAALAALKVFKDESKQLRELLAKANAENERLRAALAVSKAENERLKDAEKHLANIVALAHHVKMIRSLSPEAVVGGIERWWDETRMYRDQNDALHAENERLRERAAEFDAFTQAIIATEPHIDTRQPLAEAIMDKVKENQRLREVNGKLLYECKFAVSVIPVHAADMAFHALTAAVADAEKASVQK